MLQRLFEITHLLLADGQATAAGLAERFGVSARTIYRDIDALSLAGVPVYTERGKGGGIRILPDYVLDKALFSKEEQTQLLASIQGVSALGTPGSDAALAKLAALFGPQQQWLEVDFAPWGGGEEARNLFHLLRQSILQRKLVQFWYLNSSGEGALRRVEPYTILFRGQGWYLYGYATEREDFRFFKLTRIQDARQTQTVFVPRQIPPPAELPCPDTGLDITLEIAPRAAFRVYDEFSAGQIERRPCGSFIVQCNMPPGGWLIGYLLSYGADVTVLAPESLRKEMMEISKEIYEKY